MDIFNKAILAVILIAALIAGGFYYRYQREKVVLEGQKWLQRAQDEEMDRMRDLREEAKREWDNNSRSREPKVNYIHR